MPSWKLPAKKPSAIRRPPSASELRGAPRRSARLRPQPRGFDRERYCFRCGNPPDTHVGGFPMCARCAATAPQPAPPYHDLNDAAIRDPALGPGHTQIWYMLPESSRDFGMGPE
jgi:hypothetical protein